jgi:hypothetical protein
MECNTRCGLCVDIFGWMPTVLADSNQSEIWKEYTDKKKEKFPHV